MFRKISLFIFFYGLMNLSQGAMARTTKVEKSIRRAEYWGLYADLYRARACAALDKIDKRCIDQAIFHAKLHGMKLDGLLSAQEKFLDDLIKIEDSIQNGTNEVASTLMEIMLKNLSQEFSGSIAPVVQPLHSKGEAVFLKFCQSCHGDGLGSLGRLSNKLGRRPIPFNVKGRFETLTPFGVYAVMIHGIENSEMTSMLDVLDVDELWAVAFYVSNLQISDRAQISDPSLEAVLVKNKEDYALSSLAVLTNKNLSEKLKQAALQCDNCLDQIAYIRKTWTQNPSTVRLGQSAQTPVQKTESRALKLLLMVISAVSLGFYFVLRRRSRVK